MTRPVRSACRARCTATASVAEAVAAGRFTTWARRASSAPSPTGWAPSCRPTRSGGSTGSSSTTGSTSRTPTRDRRRSASAPPGSGSSRRTSARCRPTTTQRRHRAPHPQLDLRLAGLRLPTRSTPRSRSSIAAQAAHVRADLTPERNHRTLELYALLIAALALPGLDLTAACAASRWPSSTATSRGLPRRRRPPRGLDALPPDRPALVPRRARERRRFGIALPGAVRRPARARLRRSRVHCHRPDGRIPALSDADTRRLPRAARAGRPSCSAAPRRRGTRRDAHVDFPDGGYFVQRSGWDAGRALPDLRLRPAGRRRPRPLRPAERRAVRGRAAAARRPRPRHVLRGAAEPAPLVQRHGRAQHRLRRRARPDALHAQAPARAGRRGPLPRPRDRTRPRRARRRGAQPRLRRRPPAPGPVVAASTG